MRAIVRNVTISQGQTLTTEACHSGGRREGWRLFDGKIRAVSEGGSVATVIMRHAFTQEVIDSFSLTTNDKQVGADIKVPGEYYFDVQNIAVGDIAVTIFVDGDEGRLPEFTLA